MGNTQSEALGFRNQDKLKIIELMKRLICVIGALYWLGTFSLVAQNIQFTVEVSTDSVLLGHTMDVQFVALHATKATFEEPSFEGFDIISGPNQSSVFQSINGQQSRKTIYSYKLRPRDIGNYYIPPASLVDQDIVLETDPIEIMVVPNPDEELYPDIQSITPDQLFNMDELMLFGDMLDPDAMKKLMERMPFNFEDMPNSPNMEQWLEQFGHPDSLSNGGFMDLLQLFTVPDSSASNPFFDLFNLFEMPDSSGSGSSLEELFKQFQFDMPVPPEQEDSTPHNKKRKTTKT